MKRILSGILAFLLVLSLLPAMPLTVQAATNGVYTYTVSSGKATITDYSGAGGKITIPSTLGGYPVTGIGDEAFANNDSLTHITIPEGVTSIGELSFCGCDSLTSVAIGNSVKSIGKDAFSGCDSLTNITIPNSVTSIGDEAFCFCGSLTSITIPDSVTSIGEWAFYGNFSLTSVTIGNGLKSIGVEVFGACRSLTSITIPDSVTSIGGGAFEDCDRLSNVTIPNSVASIGVGAFSYCKGLKNVKYTGTETQREEIAIESGNYYLENATWYYNFCGANAHTYTDACDDACDTCGVPRTPPHIYDNACDTQCNLCGIVRIRDHVYDNACDTQCNVCSLVRTVGDHVYDNDCDTQCNVCSLVRTVGDHVYDNACDAQCNVCAFVRTVGDHIYDNACDTQCNACSFVRTVGDHVYTLNGGHTCSNCKYSKAPAIPAVLAVSTDSLTLVSKDGVEYSADGITWQDSPTFNNLTQNTQYTFYQRVKASDNALVSEPSPGLVIVFRTRTIQYDANGGQDAPENQNAIAATTVTLSSSIPTRDGFKFAGWATKESCGRQCAPGEQLLLDKNIVFYALWEEECATCNGAGEIVVAYDCTCGDGKVTETTNYCTSCRRMNCITTVQTGSGKYTYCNSCGAYNTGSYDSYTYKHGACNGTGKLSRNDTCSTCAGCGIKKNRVSGPIINSYTDTKVTLRFVDGYEYSSDGATWQTSNVFTGLSPATRYTFYCRVGATEDTPFGLASNGTTVKTDKSKQTQIPGTPAVESFTSNSITLVAVDGCEYSKNGTTWQSSNVFSGLSCGTEYTFYQRYKETTTTYAGKSSEAFTAKTDKGTQSRPSAPTLSGKTHNSVTLYAISGYEYSRDGVNWQTSNVFTGLEAETNYVFYQRKTETATYYTSEASTALTVKTDEAPAYISGDLDDDFEITDWDGVLLARYLAGWTVSVTNIAAMDIDGDGEVTDWDGVVLDRYLAGWNVTIG